MFPVWSGFESTVGWTFYEIMSREFRNKGNDEEDVGQSRYLVLLRLSWTFSSEESFYVRMFKLEG